MDRTFVRAFDLDADMPVDQTVGRRAAVGVLRMEHGAGLRHIDAEHQFDRGDGGFLVLSTPVQLRQ